MNSFYGQSVTVTNHIFPLLASNHLKDIPYRSWGMGDGDAVFL